MSDVFDEIVNELQDGHTFTTEDEAAVVQIRNVVPDRGYQDPLQREILRMERGARDAGTNDEFYAQVEAQISRMKEIVKQAGYVGNPPSAVGQPLGGNARLTSDVVINQKSVARWQGSDGEVCPVTVNAGLVTPLLPGGSLVVRPFIYVHWGAFGFNYVAEVDIGMGRQFTVNASMVEVAVALEALSAANAAEANMAATLSFKAPMRTSPLIRTRYLDSVAQNVAQTVVIPPFAVGLLPVQMVDVGGTVTLDFYDSSNTLRYTLSVPNGSQVASIPLTGDIVRLIVKSTAATTQHIRLPFELSF